MEKSYIGLGECGRETGRRGGAAKNWATISTEGDQNRHIMYKM